MGRAKRESFAVRPPPLSSLRFKQIDCTLKLLMVVFNARYFSGGLELLFIQVRNYFL